MSPDEFAHAIAIIESGDDPNAPLGDHGRALGRYQMHPDFTWDWARRLNIHPQLNETWDSFQYRLILKHYAFYINQGLTDVQCAMTFHEGHLCREDDPSWDAGYADKFNEQLNSLTNARSVHIMPTPKPRSNKWYGWIPDYPDHRDKRAALSAPAGPLPASVDLRGMMTAMPPYDQGDLGSCTANAAAAAFQFVAFKEAFSDHAVPSRLFIYYNERALEGTVDTDAGAQVRDSLKVIALQGSVPETEWPYDITQFAVKPLSTVYDDAAVEKSIVYESVFQNRQSIQTVLASGYPVIFGFTVYNSFESEAVALTGVVPMPGPSDYIVGGHAVMIVGYDNTKSVYLVRNSWGLDWGMDHGYCTLPFAYVENVNLADDFWVLRAV